MGYAGGFGPMPVNRIRLVAMRASSVMAALLREYEGATVVHRVKCHESDSGVTVGRYVLREELPAASAHILDLAETLREVGPVLRSRQLRSVYAKVGAFWREFSSECLSLKWLENRIDVRIVIED
jgi:hypothetical protein